MKIKRTERGWAGHFICAQDCTFKRNTLLQYGKKYIVVSTVGWMRRKGANGVYHQPEEIGVDRYYETMSFYSDDGDDIYHDADVTKEIYTSDAKWSINKKEIETYKDTIDNVADKMHEDYVSQISQMLIDGEL